MREIIEVLTNEESQITSKVYSTKGGDKMYIYKKTEQQLWTVGFYTPEGKWEAESDHDSKEEAAKRVHYLNGAKTIEEDLPHSCKDCDRRFRSGIDLKDHQRAVAERQESYI